MRIFSTDNKVLAVNVVSQWAVQIANYLIPLLIIPYVSRVLGPELFGAAGYAQNIIAYLTFLVNFGFGISATQDVALNKDNPEKLRSVFWTVICFKALMLVVSFFLLLGLYLFMPRVRADFSLFVVAWLFNIGTVLFPYWFFQGMERMGKMGVFVFLFRVLGALFVVLAVKEPEHVYRYLFSLSLANIIVGIVSFIYVVRRYKLNFHLPSKFYKSSVVKKSVPAFVNAFFVDCNMLVGMTILGNCISDYDLGVYSGAQKIMTAILMVASQPISIALFPRISKKFVEDKRKGLAYLCRCLWMIGIFAFVVSLSVFYLSPIFVQFMLGEQYYHSVTLLRLLSPLPFLSAIATTLTMQGLFGMQLQRFAPMVGLLVFLSNCVLCGVLVPLLELNGAVYSWMICQLVEIACVAAIVVKNRK